ncbi:MAG: dihydropyrimidinase [Spirochaetaceae bacterium]|jgi:dihydropyrimidinase|nr:dihydropyrimidinase [Spirochaetaceae bacterium]
MQALIKGALVVGENQEAIGDVRIAGERIAAVGQELTPEQGEEIIDAKGKILIPGGIDGHTHLCLDVGFTQVSDDFYTGTLAAAWGGTTTIVDHPGFGPAGCPLDHQIHTYHALAQGKAVIDYGFHGVIQHLDGQTLAQMSALAEEGIPSYKVYLTYDYKLSDSEVYQVLVQARKERLLIAVHPENDGIIGYLRGQMVREGKTAPSYHPLSRPVACEAEAINRMILWANLADDAPLYIVHLSNERGLTFIRDARRRGQQGLYVETCPQYLLLDDRCYDQPGAEGLKYLMCPPLRSVQDREGLWEGLVEDIDIVATDHCPFFFETQKLRGKDDFTQCPSGAPGIEERIPLLFSEGVMKKRISLRRFVDLCSTNPAKLFGMYPQKGVIRPGSDADLVIIDPAVKKVLTQKQLHARVDYSAYEGWEVQGYPEWVISRGEVLIRQGVFSGKPGRGKFIPRQRPPAVEA